MKFLLCVVLLSVATPALVAASEEPDMWCIVGWNPRRTCELESSGNCLPHTERFETESACDLTPEEPEAEEEEPAEEEPEGPMYCITGWNPQRTCGEVGESTCEEGHTERFTTMEECEQTPEEPEAEEEEPAEEEPEGPMYCITGWNPQRTCGEVGESTCEEGHTERFTTMEECLHGAEEEPANADMYCVTSWNPRECGMIGEGNCEEGHTERFPTNEECAPTWNPDGQFCRIAWWPPTCEAVSLGNCLRFFYPRYDSMQQCNPRYQSQCYADTHGSDEDTCGNYDFYDGTYDIWYEGFVGLASGMTYWFDIPMDPTEVEMSFAVEKTGSDVSTFYAFVEADSCQDAYAMTYSFEDIDMSSWSLADGCEYVQLGSVEDMTMPVRSCHDTCPTASQSGP